MAFRRSRSPDPNSLYVQRDSSSDDERGIGASASAVRLSRSGRWIDVMAMM